MTMANQRCLLAVRIHPEESSAEKSPESSSWKKLLLDDGHLTSDCDLLNALVVIRQDKLYKIHKLLREYDWPAIDSNGFDGIFYDIRLESDKLLMIEENFLRINTQLGMDSGFKQTLNSRKPP